MYSIPQTHVQSPSPVDCTDSNNSKVLLFNPAFKSIKKRSQPCIFCGATVRIQNFKGKTVCSSCLQHIPDLFLHKRVQLV